MCPKNSGSRCDCKELQISFVTLPFANTGTIDEREHTKSLGLGVPFGSKKI